MICKIISALVDWPVSRRSITALHDASEQIEQKKMLQTFF